MNDYAFAAVNKKIKRYPKYVTWKKKLSHRKTMKSVIQENEPR